MSETRPNYSVLSPIGFLTRSANLYSERTAIVYGSLRRSWSELHRRCCRLAAALIELQVRRGDVVSILSPNTPAMIEAHFAVPMIAAILNAVNTRLDPASMAYILSHSESRIFLVDQDYLEVASEALRLLPASDRPFVIWISDDQSPGRCPQGEVEYEQLFVAASAVPVLPLISDEQDPIALNYTSGTTGRPKGVLYHHRGAYLNAIDNILTWSIPKAAVFLWTLPMFHCNGWCFPWSITAVGGTHVCLRSVSAQSILAELKSHPITHLCGAPVVMGMIVEAQMERLERPVAFATAGSPPCPDPEGNERLGFEVTQFYGLTETYGPIVSCEPGSTWGDLSPDERAGFMARQGVRRLLQQDVIVADPQTLELVAKDRKQLGEILLRGNALMTGYSKDDAATTEAFRGGWFHTGDLAVWDADEVIEIKDRSKDTIISGGENISSIEIERARYQHPSVLEVAVVGQRHEKWGETPCAFVRVKRGDAISEDELLSFCRSKLARYKVPRRVVFGELPKTSTGKIKNLN
ncbi:AMP-binding protein [Rhizobium leguminosarum]|uniref:3-methylmercaptopropionyl-CoA ligase n=2 Tax=Rhizobium leguminosarum TaxID=384 RepID=A0A154IQ94_RHILE|nr:AMP-binding protein [Rhizobium leguminosarum]KZB02741.1 acyl-CoA synthetase [Rhizobium leguminosarum]